MTRKEISIFIMGVVAAILLTAMHNGKALRYFLLLYAWGLLFETLTTNLWKYHPGIGASSLTVPQTQINILFPFGWMFLCSSTAALSSGIVSYILFTGLVGNLMEMVFLRAGFWTYNYDQKFLRLFYPFRPVFTIFGVPWQIVVSYFLMIGPVNYFLTERFFL